jgi:hypothetical protein
VYQGQVQDRGSRPDDKRLRFEQIVFSGRRWASIGIYMLCERSSILLFPSIFMLSDINMEEVKSQVSYGLYPHPEGRGLTPLLG